MHPDKRILIVSNRLPLKISREADKLSYQTSEGGLATGLGSIYQQANNVWLGWPGASLDPGEQNRVTKDLRKKNLHGTGTANNDSSEGKAVEKVFGEKIPPASSTKGFTGHTLGGAGGVEAVFSTLALRDGLIFPNLRWATQMEDVSFAPVTALRQGQAVRHVLSNSFGFGGNCSSLIFSKC